MQYKELFLCPALKHFRLFTLYDDRSLDAKAFPVPNHVGVNPVHVTVLKHGTIEPFVGLSFATDAHSLA